MRWHRKDSSGSGESGPLFDTVMSHFWQIIRLKWPLINYFCMALTVISSSYNSYIEAAFASLRGSGRYLNNLIGLRNKESLLSKMD